MSELIIHKHRIYPAKSKVICNSFFNSKSCKSCKRCHGVFKILKPLYVALASVGFNISLKESETGRKKSWRCCLPNTVVILMHLFLVYRAILLTFRVKRAGDTIKLSVLLIIRESLVLFIWYAVYLKSKRLSAFVRKFHRLSELLLLQNNRKMFVLLRILLLLTYSYPIFIPMIMTSMKTIEEAEKYEYIAAFGSISKCYTYYIDFTLYSIYNFYMIPVPLLVAVLYVYLCVFISEMLRLCVLGLKKYRHLPIKIDKFFYYSCRISTLIEKMEEAMSVCIFFVIILNLTICFTSFAYMLGYYEKSPSTSVGVVTWFICNAASFLSIVWMASNVNNESRNLKRTFMKILHSFEESETIPNAICMRISQIDATALSGWQMFDFSKSLILTAAGTILTYGLLILQVKPSK